MIFSGLFFSFVFYPCALSHKLQSGGKKRVRVPIIHCSFRSIALKLVEIEMPCHKDSLTCYDVKI